MKLFPNRAEFEEHFLENHLTAEDRVLPCLVVSFISILSFVKNEASTSFRKPTSLFLQLQEGCEEKFALTSERNKHMDAAHEKTIPCNHCDKKFYGAREAEAHVTRWHTDDGTPRVSED